jgi:4-hydroxybenzoate polyprenyltransferase
MIKEQFFLTIASIIAGVIGLACTYFLNPLCFLILIPMGALSTFYVVPLIAFYTRSPTLRAIPYLKIFIIGFVWSLIVVALPFVDSQYTIANARIVNLKLEIFQNFLFIIAITLPFDIRDIDYDKSSQLKTIPLFLGVTKTILLSEVLLISSILLLYISNITPYHFYALLIGHLLTMFVIAFSKKERSELFFSGAVEGLIIVNYGCVLIAEIYFYP